MCIRDRYQHQQQSEEKRIYFLTAKSAFHGVSLPIGSNREKVLRAYTLFYPVSVCSTVCKSAGKAPVSVESVNKIPNCYRDNAFLAAMRPGVGTACIPNP